MTVTVSKSVAYVVMLSPLLAVSKQAAYFVMLPAVDTLTATINFGATLSLTIDATEGSGAVIEVFPRIEFRSSLRLGMSALPNPGFACAAPAPKNWERNTPTSGSWVCTTVAPAEECDVAEAANDDLDLVSGDRLVTVDGFGIKLVG